MATTQGVIEVGRQHSVPLLALILIWSTLSAWIVNRLIISPTRKLPGPWYTKLSTLFVKYHEFFGTKRQWIHDLHLRYGSTVRLAPNEVVFASPEAVKEIYVSKGGYAKTDVMRLFRQEGVT